MDKTRLNKINRLIQKELGELFLTMSKDLPGTLISVTVVRTSSDLSVCRAYLSIFPSDRQEEIFNWIQNNVKVIRFELGKKVKTQLRKIPELTFFIDDSLDYIDRIDELLKDDK